MDHLGDIGYEQPQLQDDLPCPGGRPCPRLFVGRALAGRFLQDSGGPREKERFAFGGPRPEGHRILDRETSHVVVKMDPLVDPLMDPLNSKMLAVI